METRLLEQLYSVHSPSGGEKKMRKFIKDYIKRYISDATLGYDRLGNIYVTRGVSDTYPCVVSHVDQVQEKHGKDFQCVTVDGKIYGFSPRTMEMRGLGADDKNGIWVCLQVLKKYAVMKCAFFVGEEVGCVGSDGADMSFFDDCRYVLECDRRNGGDLITSIFGDLCSKEFLDATNYKSFGYKETNGLTTDVGTLKDNGLKVSCVNMSCGYYRPHTDTEYTVLAELENCLHFVENIIENCTDVYPHEGSSYKWGGRGLYDDLYDYNDWGGYSYHGKNQPITFGNKYGSFGYRYNPKSGKYDYVEKKYDSQFEELVDADDEEPILDELDIDSIKYEIQSDLELGMTDEDIVTDVQIYYPDLESALIQGMIDNVRNSYSFRNFS